MGPIWGRQDPGGPHVDSMNLVIGVVITQNDRGVLILATFDINSNSQKDKIRQYHCEYLDRWIFMLWFTIKEAVSSPQSTALKPITGAKIKHNLIRKTERYTRLSFPAAYYLVKNITIMGYRLASHQLELGIFFWEQKQNNASLEHGLFLIPSHWVWFHGI